MNYVFCDRDILKLLSKNEIFTLVVLQEYARHSKSKIVISITISHMLLDLQTDSRSMQSILSQSITGLVAKGVLKDLYDTKTISKSTPLCFELALDKGFKNTPRANIRVFNQVIFSSMDIRSKISMVSVLSVIIAYRGFGKYSYPKLENIENLSGCSRKTVLKSIQSLKMLDIIQVLTVRLKNGLRGESNIYIVSDIAKIKSILSEIQNKYIISDSSRIDNIKEYYRRKELCNKSNLSKCELKELNTLEIKFYKRKLEYINQGKLNLDSIGDFRTIRVLDNRDFETIANE